MGDHRVAGPYLRFSEEGVTWPDPRSVGEVEWRLRYAPETVTRGDLLLAASVIGAYRQIVSLPLAWSRRRLAGLRRAVGLEGQTYGTPMRPRRSKRGPHA